MSMVQDNTNLWYKASNGFAPPGTVVGGQDSTGEPIYVARANHEKDVIPGKLVASHGCAFISWNGEEIRKTEYEVLVGNSNNWIATSGQNIPSDAFQGGQIYGAEKLFVGRVCHEGSITTGKVQKTHGVCYIPYGGKELRFTEYEVLTKYNCGNKPLDKNYWVRASHGDAPPGTLVGGRDITGEPIYVARASHNGDLIPGKLVASHHCTYISWGGLEFKKDEYEVLVGGSNRWVSTDHAAVPAYALIGGETSIGDTLYVGRVLYNGSITTGKVHKSQGLCYIPFDGKELHFTEYEVLMT